MADVATRDSSAQRPPYRTLERVESPRVFFRGMLFSLHASQPPFSGAVAAREVHRVAEARNALRLHLPLRAARKSQQHPGPCARPASPTAPAQVPLHLFTWWFEHTPADTRTAADWAAWRECCNEASLQVDHVNSEPRDCERSNLDLETDDRNRLKRRNIKKR